jgi:hypothetical protein
LVFFLSQFFYFFLDFFPPSSFYGISAVGARYTLQVVFWLPDTATVVEHEVVHPIGLDRAN